jgi:hypothetical protein
MKSMETYLSNRHKLVQLVSFNWWTDHVENLPKERMLMARPVKVSTILRFPNAWHQYKGEVSFENGLIQSCAWESNISKVFIDGYMCRKPFNDIVFCKWTIYGSNVQWMEEEIQFIDGAIRAEWIRVTKWNIGCSADHQDLQQEKIDESDYLPFWQTSLCSQITAGIRSNRQSVNAHARSFCAAEYAICHLQGHS